MAVVEVVVVEVVVIIAVVKLTVVVIVVGSMHIRRNFLYRHREFPTEHILRAAGSSEECTQPAATPLPL